MSIQGIEAVGFTPFAPPVIDAPQAAPVGTTDSGNEFADLVIDGIDRLQSVQTQADQLAVQAATGDLDSMHDYTIAATEASVTTSLTVALRNRAVEAFTEIMRMQV